MYDDTILLAANLNDFQEILDRLHNAVRSMDLKINISKIKIIVLGRKNDMNVCKLYLIRKNIKQIDSFVNLERK